MMKVAAEIATAFKQVKSPRILELIEASGFHAGPDVLVDGKKASWDLLKKSKSDWRLAVEGIDSAWHVNLSAIQHHDLSLVQVDGPQQQVEKFCECSMNAPGVVQARVYDEQYDRLQNLTNLSEFENAGLRTEGLALVSNGLPFPLEEMVVDTCKSPGRRILRDGFIECIGNQMWFANEFVERLQLDLQQLSTLGRVTKLAAGAHLSFSDSPFTTETPKEIQNAIREQLYGAGAIA